MKTWMKLLAVAAVLGLAVADEVEGQACNIRSFNSALQRLKPCVMAGINEQMSTELRGENGSTLTNYRNFFKDLCPNVPQIVACMAKLKESLQHCQNRNGIVSLSIASDLMEHMITGGCENEGERLANIAHGAALLRNNRETQIPLRRCLEKVNSLLEDVDRAETDVTSHYYLLYIQASKFKMCSKHVEDEDSKVAMEWAVNEVVNTLKCQHPEEDKLVPCGDIDVSKVKVINICALKSLNDTHLYDSMESEVIHCHSRVGTGVYEGTTSGTRLESLKAQYKSACGFLKRFPDCVVRSSSFSEACLSQEEDKQFQLFVQSMEDLVERSCVEDGAGIANIMHEVYRLVPEHGNALDVCYNSVIEASKSHEGHAVSSKNMRFYHEMTSFQQCVVGKLHENNDVSKDVESIINDVLKKMKCVNPVDGTVVLCETIHEH